jgi:hypothetical protein
MRDYRKCLLTQATNLTQFTSLGVYPTGTVRLQSNQCSTCAPPSIRSPASHPRQYGALCSEIYFAEFFTRVGRPTRLLDPIPGAPSI